MTETKGGVIFNIQKFSLDDGPGIRTVVFLKGCPLSCAWCANPESQDPRVQSLWDKTRCRGCLNCVKSCPENAVVRTPAGITVDPSRCTGCGLCARICPEGALSIEGEHRSVNEIVRICLQDRDFYEESGGGVTLSGGEALAQPEFALSLLSALKGRGIHTAVETTGFAREDVFDRVTKQADLLLYDIKHWNEERHIEGTGVSNRQILSNLKRAAAAGAEILPRLPVIPGFNNSEEDARGFCEILQEAGLGRIQLLPFHQFGENKYTQLGRSYAYTDVPALHEEDLMSFQKIFLDAGIDAFF